MTGLFSSKHFFCEVATRLGASFAFRLEPLHTCGRKWSLAVLSAGVDDVLVSACLDGWVQ